MKKLLLAFFLILSISCAAQTTSIPISITNNFLDASITSGTSTVVLGGLQTSLIAEKITVPFLPLKKPYYVLPPVSVISYCLPAPQRAPFNVTASLSNRGKSASTIEFANKSFADACWSVNVTDLKGNIVCQSINECFIMSQDPKKIKLVPGKSLSKTFLINMGGMTSSGTYKVNATLLSTPRIEVSTIIFLE